MSINQFKKAERKNALSAEARRILSILADNPIDTIATEKNGRPFFHNGNMDFNISHSGAAVAVSLVQGENIHGVKFQTGCDIQLIRPRENLRNIAEENFSAAERDYIFSQDKTQFESTRFFQIWTLKECYIKLRGLSVFDMPKVPSFFSVGGETRTFGTAPFGPGADCDAADRYLFTFNASGSSPLSFYLYELAYDGERYMLATAIEGGLGIRPEIRMFSQPAALLVPKLISSIAAY